MSDTGSTTSDNRIFIDQIIRKNKPGLYRILPGFLLRYIKRVIHQDDLNLILTEKRDLEGLEFINGALDIMQITHTVEGLENIPREGRYIFVANHPLGGLDGMVFIKEVGKIFPDLLFPVNDLLFNIPNLRSIFIPINKLGGRTGKIMDMEWKKHFIIKAIQHKRDIIPVHFSGKNSNFFYALANIRKFFRIKINIEMFYLFDEMFMQKDKKISMKFGKPIPHTTFDKFATHQEWANWVKDLIYSMVYAT